VRVNVDLLSPTKSDEDSAETAVLADSATAVVSAADGFSAASVVEDADSGLPHRL